MKLLKLKKSEWYYLNYEDRILIYNLINEELEKNWYKNYILNVLSDHIHLVLYAEEYDLAELVRKLKAAVSFRYSKIKKYTQKWEWRQSKIWARWYSKTYLDIDEHYNKAVKYTLENHTKHNIDSIYITLNRGL